jgi:nucleotide-binding universal stress UspA family protein
MAGWKRFCCPIDFSAVSALAMEEAVRLARRFRASVTLLYVHEPLPPPDEDATLASHEALEQAKAEHERQLAGWQERARKIAGMAVDCAVVEGDPATEILRFAAEGRCDVLVMGTHGRTPREGVAFGSVAQRTVLEARCPVLVVHLSDAPVAEALARA